MPKEHKWTCIFIKCPGPQRRQIRWERDNRVGHQELRSSIQTPEIEIFLRPDRPEWERIPFWYATC